MINRLFAYLFLLSPLSIGYLSAAEGLRTLPETAEAMGKVGGRHATLGDASVVRANPASMLDLDGTHFQFNFQLWHGTTEFESDITGQTLNMEDPWKPLGSLFLTHRVNEDLALGLGFGAPFGLSISWPSERPLRYNVPYKTELTNYSITPGLAYRVNQQMTVGVGLDIQRSELRMSQSFPYALLSGGLLPDNRFEFLADGWGIGAYGSINYDIDDRQRVSVIARTPISVDYEGSFEPNDPSGAATPSTFLTDMTFPGSVAFGYGLDLSDKTTIGFDFEWVMNSSHDDVPLDIGAANQPLLAGQNTLPLDWKDNYSAGFGIEHQATEELTLRAGYLFSESPISDYNYSPAIPANDRHIFSGGIGFDMGQNHIDLAYSYIHMADRDISRNFQADALGSGIPAVAGNHSYGWHIMTFSVSREF